MTAMEFIKTEMYKRHYMTEEDFQAFRKAFEMEKEQIKFFFDKGHLYSGCKYGLEEIYLKTFNREL